MLDNDLCRESGTFFVGADIHSPAGRTHGTPLIGIGESGVPDIQGGAPLQECHTQSGPAVIGKWSEQGIERSSTGS